MNGTLERPTSPAEQPQRRPQRVLPACDLLTGPQICALLGIHRDTWLTWRKAGFAPEPERTPGHPRWRRDVIADFRRGIVEHPRRGRYMGAKVRSDRSVSVHDRTSVGASTHRG